MCIYIERERDRPISLSIYIYIYICVFLGLLRAERRRPGVQPADGLGEPRLVLPGRREVGLGLLRLLREGGLPVLELLNSSSSSSSSSNNNNNNINNNLIDSNNKNNNNNSNIVI